MKVYDITYTNGHLDGSAIVAACSANQARILLQSIGSLNAGRYNITRIDEIGNSNQKVSQLISETYYKPRIVERTVTDTNSKFNVDDLSDEDIEKLSSRLNIKQDTIYVDRIGALKLDNKADDGYLVFNTHPDYVFNGIDVPRDEGLAQYGKPEVEHLYIKRDGSFVDLGVPKSRYIMSCTKKLTISTPFNKDQFSDTSIVQKRESLATEQLGLFVRRTIRHKGSTRKGYWKYIKHIGTMTYGSNNILVEKIPVQDILFKKAKELYNDNIWTGTLTFPPKGEELVGKKCVRIVVAIGKIKRCRRPCINVVKQHYTHYRMKGVPLASSGYYFKKK